MASGRDCLTASSTWLTLPTSPRISVTRSAMSARRCCAPLTWNTAIWCPPSATSWRTTSAPMKPVPPVIRTRMAFLLCRCRYMSRRGFASCARGQPDCSADDDAQTGLLDRRTMKSPRRASTASRVDIVGHGAGRQKYGAMRCAYCAPRGLPHPLWEARPRAEQVACQDSRRGRRSHRAGLYQPPVLTRFR